MSRWPLVIFDFDGTLMDTEQGIVWAMAQTVQQLELPPTLTAQWRSLIGLSLDAQAQILVDPPLQQLLKDTYRQFYSTVLLSHSQPFAGAKDLLTALSDQGLKIAIASSKRKWAIEQILALQQWDFPIAPIVTPTELTRPKPDPESVQVILAHHRLPPEAAIMVGDSRFDIETAVQGGITACGVGWGVHDQAELAQAGAHYWVADFPALSQLLLGEASIQ